MEECRDKRKMLYNRNAIGRNFKPGDQVLVMAIARPNNLSVNWIGPGVIESKISEANYMVQLPKKHEKSQLYHVNLLKP